MASTPSLAQCPYCGQPIGKTEQESIKQREQDRLGAALEEARKQIDEDHQGQVSALASQLHEAQEAAAKLPELVEQRLGEEKERLKADLSKEYESRALSLESDLATAQEKARLDVEETVRALRSESEATGKSLNLMQEQLRRSQKSAEDLQRQLEQTRAPHETGGLAEDELERQLRHEFPSDHVQRTPKGVPGADVSQRVWEEGLDCGVILYECKDTKSWGAGFVSKLASDKTAAGAAYAILVSTAGPPKSNGFAVLDGVTIVQPRFALDLVRIIRDTLVIAKKSQSAGQNSGFKAEELLSFLQSPDFVNKVKAALKAIGELESLQSREQRAHELLWKRQTVAQATVRKQIIDVETEITRIIVGS